MEIVRKYSLLIGVAIILMCFLFPITYKNTYQDSGYVLRFIFLSDDPGGSVRYYIDEVKWSIQILVAIATSSFIYFGSKAVERR